MTRAARGRGLLLRGSGGRRRGFAGESVSTCAARSPRLGVMNSPHSTSFRPGVDFVRSLIARAVEPVGPAAIGYAAERWGMRSNAALVTRAAVGGSDTADMLGADLLAAAAAEFVLEADRLSIVGRLTGVRRVSPNTPFSPNSDAAIASWTGEGRHIRVSRLAFDRGVLTPRKVAALLVVSLEALRATADANGEELIRRDLVRAVAKAMDAAFIDPWNGGDSITPTAISYGITPIPSTGDVATDLEAAVAAFSGDFSAAHWVMSPKTAAAISARLDLRSELGLRGGLLMGLPAIASDAVEATSTGDSITLVDAAAVCLLDLGAVGSVSTEAAIEMSDGPTGRTDSPAAATDLVSLFQADAVGLRCVRACNWSLGRPAGGVVRIDGAEYGVSV